MRRSVAATAGAALIGALLCGVLGIAAARPAMLSPFRADDPLPREPETQDASGAQEWDIGLLVDLATNLFSTPGDPATGVRAGNINTIDEVPDSNWFTNRIVARPVTFAEAARAGGTGTGPAAGPWTVVAEKSSGFAPGFTMQDAAGETWFVSFDAHGYPDAATGAVMVASRIFWTLGYFVPDTQLARIKPEQVQIGETATVRPPSGERRRMRPADLDRVWARAHRSPDGSFRAVASRRLPGRPLGGFQYHGTRPDDPNDVVPHEHRRELRALKAFGAWTNLVDMKAGNTLDMVIPDGGRSVIRHYLQDVGSTFGTGAAGPHDYDEGWEYLVEVDTAWKRLVTLGFYLQPWQTTPYAEHPGIGLFEGQRFDPVAWKPRVPTAALRHAQPDDLFWAARRVMAFSDEMIRALVDTGDYGVRADADHLVRTLIQRRDKIGAAYLTAVNPLVDIALSPEGRLSFTNAAVASAVTSPPRGYHARWEQYDNTTAAVTPLGESSAEGRAPIDAPRGIPARTGTFLRVTVTAVAPAGVPAGTPLTAYFRRTADGWMLVGVERMAR
jgi:hypothetical protein